MWYSYKIHSYYNNKAGHFNRNLREKRKRRLDLLSLFKTVSAGLIGSPELVGAVEGLNFWRPDVELGQTICFYLFSYPANYSANASLTVFMQSCSIRVNDSHIDRFVFFFLSQKHSLDGFSNNTNTLWWINLLCSLDVFVAFVRAFIAHIL